MSAPAAATATAEPLVSIERLTKTYRARSALLARPAAVRALIDVSLAVPAGGTLGIVGESGSGKSTLARTVLRLEEPDAGRVVVAGTEITALGRRPLRAFRRHMQMVFQDPYGSLDPLMTAEQTIGEALDVHRLVSTRAARAGRIAELLAKVGLAPETAHRRPHELSGGQRQRIGIARALAVRPRFLVLDEPVSALDVSVQAQIVNLLAGLQAAEGLTYLFISHDLRVVRHLCDRVAVLYLGRVVEEASAPELFDRPLHPYTRALLAAVPDPDPAQGGRPRAASVLQGEPPSPLAPPRGCSFEPRCPIEGKPEACHTECPPLRSARGGRRVACHVAPIE